MNFLKVSALIFTLLLTGCREESLLTGLDQNQANEVVSLLQKNNIAAVKKDLVKAGFSVSVAKTDFASAVDLITLYDLPSAKRVEIADMFPADALISSPRAEVARIYSAIEQRLEQTLNQIQGVVSSRVHVSYDMNNTDAEKASQPVHISALLRVREVGPEQDALIADAKRLLKNSFSKVSYDDVSVILSPVPEYQQQAPVQATVTGVSLTFYLALGSLFVAVGLIILMVMRSLLKGRGKKQ
ncbi:type III secretion system inner membrane ring lipoprotein SctJ [Pantoea sp. SORGH_AS_0659]|uniref:type III secretion system inner membrane ring lipoprotein SctJ n=1 Tax=Pantoea sp. SORGH_AS_0659 TaxID=3062597 RepID=UPI00285C7312|nr:type III secretion inner membrane ring lipoprotein SctJ [Pantoea sp. SORGH_AS_0659]MDR6352506.1 type III secretion system YscJ/HrcJ family lipoprotein [Pantoea sp. SORGH_AS_0659]